MQLKNTSGGGRPVLIFLPNLIHFSPELSGPRILAWLVHVLTLRHYTAIYSMLDEFDKNVFLVWIATVMAKICLSFEIGYKLPILYILLSQILVMLM